MSTPAVSPDFFKPSPFSKRLVYALVAVTAATVGPFLLWPALAALVFGSNDYLPHVYCYLRRPALVWTHVTADSLIGLAYLAISVTLAYLVYKARRDIPFHWMFLAPGLSLFRGRENLHRSRLANDSRRASAQRSNHPGLGAKSEIIRASDRDITRQ
jgi:hypothetical protein